MRRLESGAPDATSGAFGDRPHGEQQEAEHDAQGGAVHQDGAGLQPDSGSSPEEEAAALLADLAQDVNVQRSADPPPAPPVFPEERMADLRLQANAIMEKVAGQAGISTYKTTYIAYGKWHNLRFGVDPAVCPLTKLMWVSIPVAKSYVTYMAATGKTSAAVCLHTCPHYLLLTTCYYRYSLHLVATRYTFIYTSLCLLPPAWVTNCYPSHAMADGISTECNQLPSSATSYTRTNCKSVHTSASREAHHQGCSCQPGL